MAKAAPAKNPLAPLVDELGDLEKRVAVLKPRLARIDALRKLLRASAAELPPAEGVTISGAKYSAVIGPCENERAVNTVKLSHLISERAFKSVCTVTLGAINDLAPEVQAACIDSTQTGSRGLKVFAKAA